MMGIWHGRAAATVIVLALAALAGAGGCAVDERAEVARYRRILDLPGGEQVAYAAGNPLTLRETLLLTNNHNERLAVEGENYLQALIEKDRAAAAFLPTVSLIPSFSLAEESDDRGNGRTGGDTGGGGGDPDNDPSRPGRGSANATGDSRLDVPVNARINVFNGFRDVANLRRVVATIEQQEALLRDLQATVLLDAAQVYYQVLRSEQLVRVLENTAELQSQRVRNMRAQQDAGFMSPLDVAQTEAAASATQVSLIAARSDVWTGRTTLAFITDAPVADAPLSDALDVPEPDELGALPDVLARAEESRQDLAAARAAVAAASQGVESAVGQYYPSVSFNANAFLYRESTPTDSDWNALVSASLPIFTGGVIHANVRTALSRLRQAVSERSLVGRQVEQDVLLSYETLSASTNRLRELLVQQRSAEEAFRRAQVAVTAGTATNLDLLIAEDQLLTARLQLASEQFDRKVFYLNLLRASGRLTDAVTPPAGPVRQQQP